MSCYESDFIKYKDKCPRCGAPTQQMMSNFPYATQEAPRILTGPAGHFCTKCPTVIIDDDAMRQYIDSRKYIYGGVFSVDTGYTKEPQLFKTLNGEKTLYIFDDFETVGGIAQSVHMTQASRSLELAMPGELPGPMRSHHFSSKNKTKNRKKNKQAKQSRKQNRKK